MLSPHKSEVYPESVIDTDCYNFLRKMKYSKRAATWLLQPENHLACMSEFGDIEKAIQIIGERKKQSLLRQPKPRRKRPNPPTPPPPTPPPPTPPPPTPPPPTPPPPTPPTDGIISPETERFIPLHARLFTHKKDGKKYIEELAKISQGNPDLPQTFHAWIDWSGQWDRLVKHIEDYIPHLIAQGGDVSVIARILKRSVLEFLSIDHEYLAKNSLNIELSSQRIIVITNLYEMYVQLGLGGIEVLDVILAKLDRMRGKRAGDITLVGERRVAGGSRKHHMEVGTSHGLNTGVLGINSGASETRIVRHTQGGTVSSSNIHEGTISDRVLSVLMRVNGHLESHGDQTILTGDLVENAFGSVSLSAHVPERVRESLKDLFPNGYYKV